jgi:hypothetical protein
LAASICASPREAERKLLANGLLRQHQVRVHRFVFEFGLGFDARPYRDEEIPAFALHAVPGKVEQPDAAAPEILGEFTQRLLHLPLAGIRPQGNLESQLAERGGHVGGVIHRVPEGRILVSRVADHQRNALFILLGDARAHLPRQPGIQCLDVEIVGLLAPHLRDDDSHLVVREELVQRGIEVEFGGNVTCWHISPQRFVGGSRLSERRLPVQARCRLARQHASQLAAAQSRGSNDFRNPGHALRHARRQALFLGRLA